MIRIIVNCKMALCQKRAQLETKLLARVDANFSLAYCPELKKFVLFIISKAPERDKASAKTDDPITHLSKKRSKKTHLCRNELKTLIMKVYNLINSLGN